MKLYALSAVCGVAYLITMGMGDSWPGFGVACFVLLIIAIVSDRTLGRPSS
jgi:hypothetical protein